tara:strand:- start:509 stop:658 length:150 start_codon:yes stop_codon:yes gene_type:complete
MKRPGTQTDKERKDMPLARGHSNREREASIFEHAINSSSSSSSSLPSLL